MTVQASEVHDLIGSGSTGRTTGPSVKIAKFGVRFGTYRYFGWMLIDLVTECPLPPLSTLLENPRIKETDSFVICVQIHSPVGPFFPQQPSAAYVPKELLDGLESSLDNSSEWRHILSRRPLSILPRHRRRAVYMFGEERRTTS